MSVIVKGMRLPETCDDCEFHVYHSNREYVCVATPLFYPMNLANSKGIRKDWCPLVELPEKHGRLVDADALIDGYRHMGYDPSEHPEESYMEGWCKGFNSAVDHCMGHVIHTPTIIEAEGDGE